MTEQKHELLLVARSIDKGIDNSLSELTRDADERW